MTVAALALSTPSRADDEAAATELFNAGRDLMRRGDYAAACPKLAESARLEPTVGALAKLALCEEHERRLVSARARWAQALNLARASHDAREAEAAREFARVDASVPKVVLYSRAALAVDATIRVDDMRLSAASLGVPFAIEPGSHVVEVSAQGKRPWRGSVAASVASAGATTSLEIPPLEDAPVSAAPVFVPAPPAPLGSSVISPAIPSTAAGNVGAPWRTVSIGIGAAGVVVLGIGAVLGVEAITEKSDAGCAGTRCPSEKSAAQLEGAQATANRTTEAIIVGGALVAGGIALWLVAPRHGDARSPRIELQPRFGGAVVVGAF